MKIKDVLTILGGRDVPIVSVQGCIDDVIHVMVRFPHTRIAYVVDEQKRLVGTVTVGALLRHIFPYHYESRVHPRGILRRITGETAESIMDRHELHATPDEHADDVLKRMAEAGVKEMAVVDAQGRIIGDVTSVDLLCHYYLDGPGKEPLDTS